MNWKIFILIAFLVVSSGCSKAPECKDYSYSECPTECVVCPPCAACSSISCQTEEFCSSIGFNKSWHENIKPNTN